MSESHYVQQLARFKLNENPEGVLFVADDPELMKITVAWTSLDVRPVAKLTDPPDEPEQMVWDWLWSSVEYSMDDLADRSGLAIGLVRRKLRPLIGNRLLYPDGTANSFVQRYLRERVLKLFDARPQRSTRGS